MTGIASMPSPNSPESDSTRLGGSGRPGFIFQVSTESKGKHSLPLVVILRIGGISEESISEARGAIEIGSLGSRSSVINPGDHAMGLFLSPSEIRREKRSLAITSLPIGRSSIDFGMTRFA